MLPAATGSHENQQTELQHLLLVEDDQNRRLISLDASTYSIGRDADNSIVLKSKWISRQHAVLLRIPVPGSSYFSFRIIDGDLQGKPSTNGLLVNGKRCTSHDLEHGDVIVFGKGVQAKYYIASGHFSLDSLQSQEQDEGFSEFLYNAKYGEDLNSLTPTNNSGASEAAIIRLASFPELILNPIIEVDISGRITYLNPAAIRQFPNLRKQGLHHPILYDILQRVQKDKLKQLTREVEVGELIFEQSIHYLHESDLIRIYVTDITEHKKTELALRRSEAKNRALLNAIPDQMFQIDGNGIITNAKLSEEDAFFNPVSDCVGQHVTNIFPEVVARQIMQHIYRALQTHDTQIFEYELSENQQTLYYEARVVVSTENESLVIIRDMTQRKSYEKQLIHDALHDALTGLPNRNLFTNWLENVIELSKRHDEFRFAVLFVDLDRFKFVNDSLGHLLGDELLINIARRLEHCLRAGDIVARLGGDEFAVLLQGIRELGEATCVAERIQKELSAPLRLGSQEVFTTASIGLALSGPEYQRPEELLRDADTAMYQAKSLGRARYEIFDRSMHARAVALLQLDHDLRRAIDRQEFQIHYQPIICLSTGTLEGFEALIRWHHPHRGLVAPNEFIYLAEETGLITQIGEWILHEACQQMRRWQVLDNKALPLTMSVNLSGRQFAQQQLANIVERILKQTTLPAENLNLEITESVIMGNSKQAHQALSELKALGVKLSIDDFGTGYSSLSYLHSFQFDRLKVDRSFIQGIQNSTENSGLEITRTILILARNLGIHVIAEGIETSTQVARLKLLSCKYGQGFFFSKPLPPEAAEAFLLKTLARPLSLENIQ